MEHLTLVENPVEFFRVFGSFHDIRVLSAVLDVETKRLLLNVYDILTNFQYGDASYEPLSGMIEFVDIKELHLDLDIREGVRIHYAEITQSDGLYQAQFFLNEGHLDYVDDAKGIALRFGKLRISHMNEIQLAIETYPKS
jgi:hypothetical protein